MDTSSPWGQESAESTAASPWGQQSVQAAAVVEQQFFFHFLLGSCSAVWSFLYHVFTAPGGNRLGRFRSIFWRRGGVGGQDGGLPTSPEFFSRKSKYHWPEKILCFTSRWAGRWWGRQRQRWWRRSFDSVNLLIIKVSVAIIIKSSGIERDYG